MMDEDNSDKYSSMKVADLKRELKSKGLPTTGNKKELLERLGATMDSDDGIDAEAAEIIPSETAEDPDDVIDGEAALLEEAALVEVSGTDLLHSTSIDIDSSLLEKDLTLPPSSPVAVEPVQPEPRKISLNRDTQFTCNKENVEKPQQTKKVITINKPASAVVSEKLQDRAERFGMKASDMTEDQRKKQRAARFTSAGNNVSASEPTEGHLERLGSATSPLSTKTLSSVSGDDIIKKRQERFGVVTSPVGAKRGVDGDLKQARAARFGGGGNTVASAGGNTVTISKPVAPVITPPLSEEELAKRKAREIKFST